MERMNAGECTMWRELLAADALGDLSADEHGAVAAHREGCAGCDALARELASTVSSLALADPTGLDAVAPVPAALTERVLGALKTDSRRVNARRVTILTSIAAVTVALVVVVSILLSSVGGPSAHSVSDALRGTPGVAATAELTDKSWGTSLTFTESGQSGSGQYTVWMGARDGKWWNAGTYHAINGRRVVATMSCAVAASTVTGLRVTDSAGVTVLTYGTGSSYTAGLTTHA